MGSGEETRSRWGAGGGGGEGAGGCGHALAAILSEHLGNASQVWVVGVVRVRGGCGHALAAFKYSLNT